jgi:hypothetical protein
VNQLFSGFLSPSAAPTKKHLQKVRVNWGRFGIRENPAEMPVLGVFRHDCHLTSPANRRTTPVNRRRRTHRDQGHVLSDSSGVITNRGER